MTGEIMARTSAATINQICGRGPSARAKTIFFGGGTPTYIPVEQLIGMLDAVRAVHHPVKDAEITSESNPGTADAANYAAMRNAGFNRVSLGAQSFFEDDLLRLGRVHSAGEVEKAVALARTAGFENLNLDLMFALPGQSLRAWEHNVDRALALEPEHLSLYCLTLEPNTPFYKDHLRGLLIQPDEDAQVEMYNLAVEKTAQAGYVHYEISNFAKPGRECQHNLAYWRGEDYAAYGPGAVGCENGVRYTNWKHPERFIENLKSPWCEQDVLSEESRRLERVMLGLRLSEGITEEGLPVEALNDLEGRGWLTRRSGRVTLTADGRHFCSEAALALG